MTDWANVPKFPWRDMPHEQRQPDAPLYFGTPVAWSEVKYGVTVDLSLVHRAGAKDSTLCGAQIPPSIRRIPVLKAMRSCGRCEHVYTETAHGMSA